MQGSHWYFLWLCLTDDYCSTSKDNFLDNLLTSVCLEGRTFQEAQVGWLWVQARMRMWDVSLFPIVPLKVIWDNFLLQVLILFLMRHTVLWEGGRKDRHCEAVNSCVAVGTLKLDYTQRHIVFQHPNLLWTQTTNAHFTVLCLLENPWGWKRHTMSTMRMYRNLHCCWCQWELKEFLSPQDQEV